jgi:hypothetical protein
VKNQYFGDVNDYRKYGLLRALQKPGDLKLAVGWMLTPDDDSGDGKFRHYLQVPRKWQRYDEPLFHHLSAALSDGDTPSVAMIEEDSILPRAKFFSEVVPDERSARALWGERLVEFAAGADLVFLDPDNGFEIPSKPIGWKNSSKYVAWYEIERLWKAGSSVLVYQHYCLQPHDAFTARIAAELRRRTGASIVEAFRTANVVFLLAAQRHHSTVFEEAIACHLPQWQGQVDVVRLS